MISLAFEGFIVLAGIYLDVISSIEVNSLKLIILSE